MPEDMIRLMRSLFLPLARRFEETCWRPAADVYQTPQGWLLKFDLAGVRAEDITLSVCGRCLTVRGCRRDRFAEEGHSHYLMEIAYSHFERSIELPRDLDPARVTTEFRDGMLVVRIQTEAKP
jgi:HSP20 family protein